MSQCANGITNKAEEHTALTCGRCVHWQLIPANIWTDCALAVKKHRLQKHFIGKKVLHMQCSQGRNLRYTDIKQVAAIIKGGWWITLEENFRWTSASSAKLFFSWAQASPRVLRIDKKDSEGDGVRLISYTWKGPHTRFYIQARRNGEGGAESVRQHTGTERDGGSAAEPVQKFTDTWVTSKSGELRSTASSIDD